MDSFLNDYVSVSPHLATVLDVAGPMGRVKLFQATHAVAEQLGIDSEPLQYGGYLVLSNMLTELELVLREGPGSWTDDPTSDRHGRIARGATEGLSYDELVSALRDFRLDRFSPKLTIGHVRDVEPAFCDVLVRWLAPRILRMLDQWRKRDAWASDLALGVITARPHRRTA